MDTNSNEWRSKGKDADPRSTVETIISLLEKNGIYTEYTEFPQSVDTCYSSRVTLKGNLGSIIGSNGKGLSHDLCKASAYAELMERLQNILFATAPLPCDPNLKILQDLRSTHYDLNASEQPECITRIIDKIVSSMDKSAPAFANRLLVNELLNELSPESTRGVFSTRKFYSLKNKEFIDLPFEFIENFTLSNGMAAGNTLEEALVQGCSEIFERYSENALLSGAIIPPSIPKDVLDNYPSVKHIVQAIESDSRYNVIIKDCSLGKNLPVVCGIICDTYKQTFGVKFGAHPSFAVALERVFSESLQGTTLEEFASGGVPLFGSNASSRQNSWNLIKTGRGSFPSSLLNENADYAFKPWPDISGKDNKQIMKYMFETLKELSDDIYVTDVSFLGFPSVMIYAAGVSESLPLDITTLKEIKLHNDVIKAFHSKNDFSPEQVQKIELLTRIKRNSILENSFLSMTGMITQNMMHGNPDEADFLRAMAYYSMGNLDEAIASVLSLLRIQNFADSNERAYIRTVYFYLDALKSGCTLDDAKSILLKLAPLDIVQKAYEDLKEPSKTLDRIFPKCPDFECENCSVSNCIYNELFDLFYKLSKIEVESKIDYSKLADLFDYEK